MNCAQCFGEQVGQVHVLVLIDGLDQVQWDRREAGYWQHKVRRDFLLIGGASHDHLLQSVNRLQSYWWCSHCHLLVGEKVQCRRALCQDGDPGIDGRVLVCQSEQVAFSDL